MPRKIQLIGPYPPPRGGVQAHVEWICEELESRGYPWELLVVPKSAAVDGNSKVKHPNGNPRQFLTYLREAHVDIVHLHIGGDLGIKALATICLVLVFARGKRLITLHSGGFALSGQASRARRHSLLGYLFRRFDYVVGVNEAMMQVLRRFGVSNDKSELIYPFRLDSPDSSAEMPADYLSFQRSHDNLIISVGGLEPEYDIPMQIDAIGQVLAAHPRAGLVVVGGGSMSRALRDTAGSKDYSSHILFAGEVARSVALRMIEDSDVLIRTTHYDGDAIAIREAMFLRTPVIATDNEMRPSGVITIDIGDSEALASNIDKILSNGSKPASQDYDSTDEFNISTVVDLYEKLAVG